MIINIYKVGRQHINGQFKLVEQQVTYGTAVD